MASLNVNVRTGWLGASFIAVFIVGIVSASAVIKPIKENIDRNFSDLDQSARFAKPDCELNTRMPDQLRCVFRLTGYQPGEVWTEKTEVMARYIIRALHSLPAMPARYEVSITGEADGSIAYPRSRWMDFKEQDDLECKELIKTSDQQTFYSGEAELIENTGIAWLRACRLQKAVERGLDSHRRVRILAEGLSLTVRGYKM